MIFTREPLRRRPEAPSQVQQYENCERLLAAEQQSSCYAHPVIQQNIAALILAALLCFVPAGCGRHPAQPGAAAPEKVVNIYNWNDYIKPDVLRKFKTRY